MPRVPHPKQSARRRAQKRASYARHATERRAVQNEKNFRHGKDRRAGYAELDNATTIVNLLELRRPTLSYIDPHGRVHREDYRSAETLIADLTKRKRRKPK